MGVKRKIEVLNERDVESRAPHTRAVSKRAGVLCVRGSKVYIGTKIQIRAKEIFVIGATINIDVLKEWHHRTGVLCARRRKVHNGTKIQIRAKEIFVLRATVNIDV